MAEPQAFIYAPLVGHIGRTRVLVQLFIDPDTGDITHAQISHEHAAGGWSEPYTLDRYTHG